MPGITFTLISIIFWGLTGVFVKLCTRTVHPLTAGYLSLFPAWVTVLVAVLIEGYSPMQALSLPLAAVFAFFTSGVLSAVSGRAFYFLSVARIGASVTTSIGSARLLIAPVAALIIFHEKLTWSVVIGTALVFAGLYFLTRD
jgi:drug/metabolite transporter (DMT)-like permease